MTTFPRVQAIILSVAVVILAFPGILRAQSFLLISPAPDGNGWGNISTAVPSDNPIAVAVNPGQLGFFSLSSIFAASSYTPKTDWLPSFQGDVTYNAWGLSAGYNVGKLLALPFSLSAGIGYSRIDLDLGTFVRTGSGGPDPIGTFHAFENTMNVSVGIGVEYFVRLGLGWNFKDVYSTLGVIYGDPAISSEANFSTSDFGVILQAPFGSLITCWSDSSSSGIQPLIDLTLGYSIANRGDESVMYPGSSEQNPLPRFGIGGMSLEIGITKEVLGTRWKILTFTIAREADDLLVTYYPDGTFEYQDGLGDISFLTNVIGGKADADGVNSRKGWQLNLAEFVMVRHGSYSELPEQGNRNYSTSGYSLHLAGLVKLVEALAPGSTSGGITSFVRDHIDIAFDHAYYSGGTLDGTSFDALTLAFR